MTRGWRAIVALTLVVAACSMLLSAWLFKTVQDSRADATRKSCVETNARHDKTIAELDRLLHERLPSLTREERERAIESRAGTVSLIEALVPRRDCEQRVRELTR